MLTWIKLWSHYIFLLRRQSVFHQQSWTSVVQLTASARWASLRAFTRLIYSTKPFSALSIPYTETEREKKENWRTGSGMQRRDWKSPKEINTERKKKIGLRSSVTLVRKRVLHFLICFWKRNCRERQTSLVWPGRKIASPPSLSTNTLLGPQQFNNKLYNL